MVYLNTALIQWHTKKQATIEGAVFGAEFVATKTRVETLRGIRYKSRMMSVKIEGPTCIYGDNQFVMYDIYKPESVLKKKSNSICYHFIRQAIVMKECLATHVPTARNFADMLTKALYSKKRKDLVGGVFHFIYDQVG